MWLDGLYMAAPFYAQYAQEFNEPEDFDDIANWLITMEKVSRDPKTGLLYHGWDERHEQKWADKKTGLSSNFWGRGMGWYGMALVDVLDYFPQNHPQRNSIIAITQRMAEAIVKVQDKQTGVWYQVLDQGGKEGNYAEGSVSCMFTYFLLKAGKMGYIDSTYHETAKFAYSGILNNLIKIQDNGCVIITPVCAVAGLGGDPYRDGSYEYYINEKQRDNDPKAVGPFIMASILYENLY
jgi:unsaturated rhamnogalacturonyl hydrolase